VVSMPITVILLSNGKEEQLKRCLQSLQLPTDWQLILVVQGNPLSSEILEFLGNTFPQVEILPSSTTLGSRDILSQVAVKARGEWIYFLHEEVSWPKGYEKRLLPLLEEHGLQ